MITKKQFNMQKATTKQRFDVAGNPIEFRLTFEEWSTIWNESGHAHERGKKKGQYCMSRNNDLGHYEVGNVSIVSNAENARERNARMRGEKRPPRSEATKQKIAAAMTGKKRGPYKKWTDEARENLSVAMTGNTNRLGTGKK